MKLHSFLKKNPLKSRTWSFFAAVLFMCCAYVPQAHAQLYTSYKNLFDGTDPSAKLKVQYPLFVGTGTGQATLTPALKFNFQGSFTWKEENDKKQHWDHIVDFDNKYPFVLRICDANAADESGCYFTKVPAMSETYEDSQTLCPNNGICTLPADGQPWQKIYHYRATIANASAGRVLVHSKIQNDKFYVIFPTDSFAQLSSTPGKGLGAEAQAKDIFKIGDKTVYKADIWYCAEPYGGEALPSSDIATEPGIRQFNKLCGDGTHAYFKIAESGTFTMPASATEALGQTASTVDQVNTTPTDTDSAGDNLPVCHILNGAGPGEGTFMGCIAQVGYYVLYYPAAWIAGIFGKIFDFFLGYSISDESYRAPVVETGWKLVRDISNIFFIIILVWTGLSAVFNIQKLSMRSVVPALIINALIINFSLFGTRLVIDVSNVTARLFYNTISICSGECKYEPDPNTGKLVLQNPSKNTIGGFKPLSEAVVDSFDPQRIFKPEILSPSNTAPQNTDETHVDTASSQFSATSVNSDLNSSRKLGVYDSAYAGYFLIVSLIAAFIMLAIAKMFFSVMFIFIGRVVGLYVAMIFSPFAVLTRGDLPIVSKLKTLAWDSWKKEVGQYVALAPLFVFFLYIIYAFINSDFVKNLKLGSDTDFMGTVLSITIPMVIIYTLVSYGAKLAKDYAGKFGEMVQGFGNKAVGFATGAALGVATGGAALVGTRYGARAARALGNSKLGQWAARNSDTNAFARFSTKALNWSQNSSWDLRKTALQKNLNKNIGRLGITPTDVVSSKVGLGEKRFEGGFVGQQKRRQDKIKDNIKKRINMEHMTDTAAKEAWQKKLDERFKEEAKKTGDFSDKQLELLQDIKGELSKGKGFMSEATKELQAKVSSGAITGFTEVDVTKLAKENRERWKNVNKALVESKDSFDKKIKDTYGKVESAKDFTAAMRRDYAQDLRDSSFWMKDGKQRKAFGTTIGGMAGGSAAGVAAGIAGVGSVAGPGVLGSVLAERVRFEQEALDEATKAYIKEYSKGKGKTSKIDQYKRKLESVNATIEEAIKQVLGTSFTKLDDYDRQDQEKHLNTHMETKQADLDEAIAAFNDAQKNYSANKNDPAARDAFREASADKKRAQNEYDRFANSWKNKDDLEDKISKEEEKSKPKDDKKDEKKS